MYPLARLLFISPHADDVCFSLAGTVASLPAERVLVTVFSRSEWAEPDWDGPRGRELITAARVREDRAFCSANGLAYNAMGFEDSSIRLNLTGNLRRADNEEPLIAEVSQKLGELLAAGDVAALFVPLGLGGHTDHRIASKAGQEAARSAGIPAVFYEDIPYATEMTMRAIARTARAIDPHLEPVVCLSELASDVKLDAARAYRSQRKEQILQSIELHSFRVGSRLGADAFGVAERVWTRGGCDALREIVGPRPRLAQEARKRLGLRQRSRAVLVD